MGRTATPALHRGPEVTLDPLSRSLAVGFLCIVSRRHRPALRNKVQPAAPSANPAGKPAVFSRRKFWLPTNESQAKGFSDGGLRKKKISQLCGAHHEHSDSWFRVDQGGLKPK